MSCSDIFLGLIAILFPPIAVWIKTGVCSCDSLINILLCMLGYIPGLIHAWYIIAKFPEHDYDRIDDPERQGRVTYYYISHEQGGRGRRQQQPQQGGPGYGTIPALPGNKPAPQPRNHQHQQPQYQSPAQPSQRPPQQSGVVRNDSAPSSSRPSGSNEDAAPPSYSEAVRGDHKIQSRD